MDLLKEVCVLEHALPQNMCTRTRASPKHVQSNTNIVLGEWVKKKEGKNELDILVIADLDLVLQVRISLPGRGNGPSKIGSLG